MASKPKTKFDNWLLTQYEIKEPVEVITHSGPEHRRLYRRDFDKVITSCEFADELKNVEPKQIVSKGHSNSTIANDQQITEHQTTLQNQQVKRNNIWAYGVHRNHGCNSFEKSLFLQPWFSSRLRSAKSTNMHTTSAWPGCIIHVAQNKTVSDLT